jgi:hypothetical protein
MTANPPAKETSDFPAATLQSIAAALAGMRYGQVTITVHDGHVVQIDRTERQRFPRSAENGAVPQS